MDEVGEDCFTLKSESIGCTAAVVDFVFLRGNEEENQNHFITCAPIENCYVESYEDDANSSQPKALYLFEETTTVCSLSETLIQCSPYVKDESQAKIMYKETMERLGLRCDSGATLWSPCDKVIFDNLGKNLAWMYILTLENVLKDLKDGSVPQFEEHQVRRMLVVCENTACDFVRRTQVMLVLHSGQPPYMCELYKVEKAGTVIIDCPLHVKCLQFYRERQLLSIEKYEQEIESFVESVQEFLKRDNLQQYCTVARSLDQCAIYKLPGDLNTDSQSDSIEQILDCLDGAADSPSVLDKNSAIVVITLETGGRETTDEGCAEYIWSINWPLEFSEPRVTETTAKDVLRALRRSRLINKKVHESLVSHCTDVDKEDAKSAKFSKSHEELLSLLTLKLIISISIMIKNSISQVYDALREVRLSPNRNVDKEVCGYQSYDVPEVKGDTKLTVASERSSEKQSYFEGIDNSATNLDDGGEKQFRSVKALQADGEHADSNRPLTQEINEVIDDDKSRVEDTTESSNSTWELGINDSKHSAQSYRNLKKSPVSIQKRDEKELSQSMGFRLTGVTGEEDAAAVSKFSHIECREPMGKFDKRETASSSDEMKAKSNQNSADKQKTTEIIKNLLFAMVEDKKYLPFDFEQQLRKGALEHGIDVAQLRNKNGCTLLHCAVIESRTPFILPIFRVGCWNTIRPLPVEIGKKCQYEGKTADEIAVILRQRKVQKELDTCTEWEKSLNMIHVSARVGHLLDVKKWLEYSSDLHTELDSMQCSTLYWACIGGNLEIVLLLLSLRVDFNQMNSRKETLLHAACMMGHSHLIQTLMTRCKLDVTLKDSAKKSPILRVSENGDEKSLAKFLECGMKKELLGPMLAIAGHYGRINFLRTVIEKFGIAPQSKDEAGKSAYIRASEQGRIDVLRYCFTKNLNFAETDLRKRNVLHAAADGAPKDVMIYLINELKQKGVNVKQLLDARDKYIGGELCMLIRGKDKGRDSWHYVEVSRGLMDIFMKRTRGGTIDVAKYGTLLQSGWGIDPDEKASREIEKRFEVRRNTTSADEADVTPLHIAVFKDKPDVVDVLLENGADVNIRDKFKMTPLHVAAMRGNIRIIRSLIDSGASTELLDYNMKSPADVAEDNEHPEAVNFMKNVKYLPAAEAFRNRVLPSVTNLLSAEHILSLHESGADIRRHLINTLRDLTVDINETLLALGSGPVLEESTVSTNLV